MRINAYLEWNRLAIGGEWSWRWREAVLYFGPVVIVVSR